MNHLQIYHDYQGGAILPRCQAAPEIEPVRVRVERKAGEGVPGGSLISAFGTGGYGEILGLDQTPVNGDQITPPFI